MAAAGGSRAIYGFAFAADSGDSWGGWFVAAAGAFAAGALLRAQAGAYTVLGQTADGLDVGIFGLVEGQVFVEWYHDGGSDLFLPTRLGPSVAAGSVGLGSELDAVWDGVRWNEFGLGGALQANAESSSLYRWYFHDITTGDTYLGWLLDDRALYPAGLELRTGNGVYVIEREVPTNEYRNMNYGTVWIDGYYDARSNRWLDTYHRQAGAPSGSAGLGSEQDWAWDGDEWDLFVAGVTQWVNVEQDSRFSFYFYSAINSDTYVGRLVADSDAYAAGSVIRTGGGVYVITGDQELGQSDTVAHGTVWVDGYHDSSTGRWLDTYHRQAGAPSGSAGLGSEQDWAWDGDEWDLFVAGVTQWVNVEQDSRFSFYFYSAINSDTYVGRFVADSDAYAAGSVSRTGGGVYVITGEQELGQSDTVAHGTVWVDGYHDSSTGRWLDTYHRQAGAPSGSAGLGSEQDWAWDGDEWDLFVAGVTQWVNVE
jgi:hypothetical protein